MVSLKLVVLSLVIMLASGGKPKPSGSTATVSVGQLVEMLEDSMQNTISLTELVGQQTQKISEITNFVDNAKKEIEDLKSKLTASEEKSGKEFETLKNNSSILDGQLATLKESMETKFEAVKNNSIILDGQLATLKESTEDEREALETKITNQIQALDKSIQDSNNEVMIISAEDGVNDANCVRTCSGIGGTEGWSGSTYYYYKTVDISSCGFTAKPIITTGFHTYTVYGGGEAVSMLIYSLEIRSFQIYIVTPSRAISSYGNKLHWTAVGYTC